MGKRVRIDLKAWHPGVLSGVAGGATIILWGRRSVTVYSRSAKRPSGKRRRAVMLTAISDEYKSVRAHLVDLEEIIHPQGTVYEQGAFRTAADETWSVGIVETGVGNEAVAFETERAIAFFDPDVVFFIGVAGGLKDVELCDVVAATRVYGYEYGKETKAFETRPNVGESSYAVIQRAKAEAKKDNWLERLKPSLQKLSPRVLIGPIAAGSKVVASKQTELYRFLRHAYGDALAVDMESRGVLRATHANQEVKALIVRGVSDLISGKSRSDRAGYQKRAAEVASAFAFEVLANLKDSDAREVGEFVLVTPATVEEIGVQGALAIQARLRELSGDSQLTLKSLQEGSVLLVLEGSKEGYERLVALFESGVLCNALGIKITKIDWVQRSPRDDYANRIRNASG